MPGVVQYLFLYFCTGELKIGGERGNWMKVKKQEKLKMCQYDTDAPAQGHPHPHAGILQKKKLKKRAITLIIIGRFYPKLNLTIFYDYV